MSTKKLIILGIGVLIGIMINKKRHKRFGVNLWEKRKAFKADKGILVFVNSKTNEIAVDEDGNVLYKVKKAQ